jgi:hypothetical protein
MKGRICHFVQPAAKGWLVSSYSGIDLLVLPESAYMYRDFGAPGGSEKGSVFPEYRGTLHFLRIWASQGVRSMLKQKRLLERKKGNGATIANAVHAPFAGKRPRWKLKGCPNCGGDLYQDEDEYTCLWCGRKRM